MKSGLSNKQYVLITLIILLCGIAIFGRDFVQRKANTAMENVIITFEEGEDPEYVEPVNTEPTNNTNSGLDPNNSGIDPNNSGLDPNNSGLDPNATTNNNSNTNTNNNSNSNNSNNQATRAVDDPSGRVKSKSKKKKSKYVGRLKIPAINFNKGFVESSQGLKNKDNCVNYNVCSMSGRSNYPDKDDSHLKIGAHNGSGWNAYFNRIEQLKKGDTAYVEYNGKRYKYKLVDTYKDAKGDYAISFRTNGANKQMSLFTCAKPTYNKYYSVLSFKLVSEEKL